MRLTFYVMLIAVIQGFATNSYSQVTKLNLEFTNSTVREVLSQIEDDSEFYFLYNSKIVDVERKVNMNVKNQKIDKVLDALFEGTDVEYTIVDRQIVLSSNINTKSVDDQGDKVTGKITDNNGLPLPGVTIVFKGTTQGTISDIDGNYTIALKEGATTLVFSFIGMIMQEIEIAGQTEINVVMQQDYIGIEEVVAIGYGTSKKEDLVSSVSQVKAEIIENQPTVRVDQALQGRAAGVEVTSTSGAPGSNAVIRIRGTSSINGNNNPLYVVDGFIAGTDFNLNNLNVNDIESIEVLKDATALAIYGTRGASGVILITSKNGKGLAKGKTQVSVNQYVSYQKTANRIELADSKLYAEYRNEEAQFVPGPDGFGYTDPTLPLIFDDPASAPYTDWVDLVSQTGLINNTDVSVTGNADKANYYISFNHFDQEGIVRGSGIERYTLRTNLDFNLSEMFTAGMRLNISKFKKENNKVNYGQIVTAVLPIREVYNEDGSFTSTNPVSGSLQRNPEADIQLRTNHDLVTNLVTNAYIEFKPIKDLVFRSSVGVELNYYKNNIYSPGALPERQAQGVGGYADINNNQSQSILNENTFTYSKDFGDHNIKVLGGFTLQKISNESSSSSAEGFPNDVLTFNNLSFGSDPLLNQVGSGYSQRTFVSYLGRLNYSYKGKYLLTLVGRRDGSSVFEAGNKYAFFPSVGVAWNAYKESFMENVDAVSMLKIRGSYGIVGEQGVSPYNSLAKFNNTAAYFNETLLPGVLIGGLPSKDLTWETTKQLDLGVEVGFLNNRFGLEADYYIKTTEDLLLARDLPGTAGGSQLQNVGSIENKGVEFSLHSVNISRPDFSWETTLTISANRNKVLDLGGDDYINLSQPSNQGGAGLRLIPGYPAPVFIGATYLGTYKTEQEIIDDGRKGQSFLGGPRYVDLDGNSVINDEDKLPIGSPEPKFYGGLNNTLNYKGFSMGMFFQFSYGNEMYNLLTHVGWFGRGDQVLVPEVADRWQQDINETSDVPRAGTSTSLFNPNSTRLIEDASFIRLKTLSFGYDLPLEKWGMGKVFSRFNVYATGNNLLLLTKWTLGDPEVSNYGSNNLSQGVATGQYPYSRTYTVGVKIDF
ncbi:TonB-dependent receptor [Prolixibacteraceae bacterium Z1-6]|uniref:TonB-dependent receptor n=1 Tax=Draconibacterium aestuarii TaxID=2998507 RepID=A0A9X3J8U3_9BACT|nr:TonB-dependent receptor [Prolixibacteraceae bacterium Z1-6]